MLKNKNKKTFNLWKKEKDMEDVEGAIEMPLFDITSLCRRFWDFYSKLLELIGMQ